MRSIHYSIRLAVVLILTALFYWGVAFLFHQAVQLPVVITLLFAAICTDRLWALLDWVGPVIGTANRKGQEQTHKQIVEYQLACSLRYNTPLSIAAVRGKKRMSLHVVGRILRRSDIVLRNSADYLFVLMPFTNLEGATLALKRLAARVPLKDAVITDVRMLQSMLDAQTSASKSESTVLTPKELGEACAQALDAKLASVVADKNETDVPAIYNLFEPEVLETQQAWSDAFHYSELAADVHVRSREENVR